MKIFYFIQAAISHNLNDLHSKALEPDCLSLFPFDYDTVSKRGGLACLSVGRGGGDEGGEAVNPKNYGHPMFQP